ncbi:MAG: coenzyme F420-0:L-glutamate ligase, partial [Thermoleophilia bacterium]|nr:coenzyme F420-0:L-glutamate ligase [Thermoleophilia bacterium]
MAATHSGGPQRRQLGKALRDVRRHRRVDEGEGHDGAEDDHQADEGVEEPHERLRGGVQRPRVDHGGHLREAGDAGAHGRAVLLPVDPDQSARNIRARFKQDGVDAAVIISDTFGRPWREAQTDIAIGVAGMNPVVSYIGQVDPHGHEFRVQALCAADELAGAAELVKGNVS